MAARPNAAYRSFTRDEFDRAAKRAGIRPRDRDHAYTWVTTARDHGQVWWSVHHAVHAFVARRLARTLTARSVDKKNAPPP